MGKKAKNQGKDTWFYVIVLVFIIVVVIFGIISLSKNSNGISYGENQKAINSNGISYGENQKATISVVGSSQVKTINNPDKIILIEIVGSDNKISVTKETQIYLIEIVGSGNIFNLCKNHSPEIDETGSNNVINYLNC